MASMALKILSYLIMGYWIIVTLLLKIITPSQQWNVIRWGVVIQVLLVWVYAYMIKNAEAYLYNQYMADLQKSIEEKDKNQAPPSTPAV